MNISLGKQCGVLQRTSGWSPWRPLPCAGSRNCEIWRKTRERGRRGERPATRGAFLPTLALRRAARGRRRTSSSRERQPREVCMRWRGCGSAVRLLEGPFLILLHGTFRGPSCSAVCPLQAGCCVQSQYPMQEWAELLLQAWSRDARACCGAARCGPAWPAMPEHGMGWDGMGWDRMAPLASLHIHSREMLMPSKLAAGAPALAPAGDGCWGRGP